MKDALTAGPWRATRLWNEIIRSFYSGMPRKKHRIRMKSVEQCFTGHEALDWLHKNLKKNPNFGCDVSREQTLLLLEKILRSGVMVPALDNDLDHFSTAELYRFVDTVCQALRTPVKKRQEEEEARLRLRLPPPPFSTEDEAAAAAAPKEIFAKEKAEEEEEEEGQEEMSQERKQNLNRSYFEGLPHHSLIVMDNDCLWSEAFLSQLRSSLSAVHVQNLRVHVPHLTFNMTHVSSKGVVQLDPNGPHEDLPHWVLSAMKCLANWPKPVKLINGQETSLPKYPGFINDVYTVVKDYFLTLGSPLIPYELYDLFESAYIKAEAVGAKVQYEVPVAAGAPNWRQQQQQQSTLHDHMSSSPTILGRSSSRGFYTMQNEARRRYPLEANQTFSTMSPSRDYSSSGSGSISLFSPPPTSVPLATSAGIMRTVLPPNSCYETAFMNENPTTRIVPQKHNETLHLHPQHAYGSRPSSSIGRCYPPISNGGGGGGGNWDSRSIATQTSVSEEEDEDRDDEETKQRRRRKKKDANSDSSSSILSRIPRRRRSARTRRSIAVMELSDTASACSMRSNKVGMINPAFVESPMKGLQKSSSSVDNLLLNDESCKFLHKYEKLSSVNSSSSINAQSSSSSQLSDHMIQSKTVRKEKRKQREKRDHHRAHSLDAAAARATISSQEEQEQSYQYTRFHKSLTVKKTAISSKEDICNPLPNQGMQSVRAEPYNNKDNSTSDQLLSSEGGVSCAGSAFALLGLLLSPGNRRKLQILLKFVKRLSKNPHLRLSPDQGNERLLLETFSDSILRAQDMANYDGDMSRKIVAFFIAHYEDVWTPPRGLRKEVEESVSRLIDLRTFLI